MKVNIELDMTPEEARRFLGLPDVAPLQAEMMEEFKKRMKAAIDIGDPEGMMRAWMPVGGAQGFEQFQQFFWDSARKMAAGGTASSKKSAKG